MPVINIGGTKYTLTNEDGENTESTLFDDYVLKVTDNVLETTLFENETFISLDTDNDGELDLYGKLGTKDGEKYIDLRDDNGELRSLSLLDDIDDMSSEKAAEVIINNLSAITEVNDSLAESIKKVLKKSFGEEFEVSDELITSLVGACENSDEDTTKVTRSLSSAIGESLN